MKIRSDFITNSSSSSFIITNKGTDEMTGREIVEALFAKILEDAENENINLKPGESTTIICGDHVGEDGFFEPFIHNVAGNEWNKYFNGLDYSKIDIEFDESFH